MENACTLGLAVLTVCLKFGSPATGGRYLGISNLATAGSGVLAGAGGFMLDYFNAQSHNMGYTVLYLSAAVCYVLGTILVLGIRDAGGRQPVAPRQRKENR